MKYIVLSLENVFVSFMHRNQLFFELRKNGKSSWWDSAIRIYPSAQFQHDLKATEGLSEIRDLFDSRCNKTIINHIMTSKKSIYMALNFQNLAGTISLENGGIIYNVKLMLI